MLIRDYAKVLAARLEPYMSSLIHPDQTGFIKSRLASDNVRRLLHIIDFSKSFIDMIRLLYTVLTTLLLY